MNTSSVERAESVRFAARTATQSSAGSRAPRWEFEVLTAKGALIRTFADPVMAMQFAAESAEVFPALQVVQVTHREPLRRCVWPPAEAAKVTPVTNLRRVA